MRAVAGRPRAVLRKFNPEQRYWHGARIIGHEVGSATLITYWHNPEMAGIWEFHYHVTTKCFHELLRQGLIEHDVTSNPDSYTLSPKGRQRLGEN